MSNTEGIVAGDFIGQMKEDSQSDSRHDVPAVEHFTSTVTLPMAMKGRIREHLTSSLCHTLGMVQEKFLVEKKCGERGRSH